MTEGLEHTISEQQINAPEQQVVYKKPVVEPFLQDTADIKGGQDPAFESNNGTITS